MSLKTRARTTARSVTQGPSSETNSCIERGKFKRTIGRAKRSYGYVNLKIDPTRYLSPENQLQTDVDTLALTKFTLDLNDLATSQKGCIIWYTLEYFEKSIKVIPYVDVLLGKCLNNEYVMELTTKNFLLLSNIVRFGESIKTQMFNNLKHIHEDILSFGETDRSENNPQLFLKYYDHDIVVSYYRFVSLLFFRFRKHLDSYRRYKSLAGPALSAIKYLLSEGSIESLKLLANFVQLNLLSLSKWFDNDVKIIVDDCKLLWEHYKLKSSDEEKMKWQWVCATLDIIYNGPVIPQSLYKRYTSLLGLEWTKTAVRPPIQILDRMNEVLINEKQAFFHINEDDIIRNMFVYLP